MTTVETPQSVCRVGFARADITPPVGIYHRMWGAATHDRSTGVHRPLTATAIWIAPESDGREAQLLFALDHCILDATETRNIREKAAAATGLAPEQVQITLSHTHGACWMSRSRSHLPGGDLIGPYLDQLAVVCARLAREAAIAVRPAVITYGTARCQLARHRDTYDPVSKQFVCGFNPAGPADDTVMLAKVITETGDLLGTVVNYACHPTTLAWENTLISPDYVGAMREVIERHTGAPCLFLQGSSGDLGPWDGYVGATATADRNGRQLGFAALGGLESIPPPGTRFVYAGPVISGAILGSWKHEPLGEDTIQRNAAFTVHRFTVDVPYRVDLPTMEDTRTQLARWQAEEEKAHAAGDAATARDCRAKAEQMTRQIARLAVLPTGKVYPLALTIWRLGGAVWIFAPGELYQAFQVTLRERFPDLALVVITLTNDWQPGYMPTAASYGYGIYQELIAAVAPGSLEVLIEAVSREITAIPGERGGSPPARQDAPRRVT